MVTRSGRELAVAHGSKLSAERLLGDGDAEFLEYPLRQIDQPPAHYAVHRWDRTNLDHTGDGSALGIIELGWVPRRLAIQQPIRATSVEAQNPIWDDLKPDPAELRCIRACRTVIDCRKSQKSAGLRAILGLSRQVAKLRRIKIQP
jgi:glucose-6-phosphate dehydrogenase assembly protein OpcA